MNEMIWAGRKRHSHTQFFKKCNNLHTHNLTICFKSLKMYLPFDPALLLPGIHCRKRVELLPKNGLGQQEIELRSRMFIVYHFNLW